MHSVQYWISSKGDRNCGTGRIRQGVWMYRRKPHKLRRLAVVLAVLSVFALPCAGWGWEIVDNGAGSDESPPAAVG